jgi:purine-binding chemotaxis protein CheW
VTETLSGEGASRMAAGDRTNPGRALAGKYMTFKLAREEYGLEILKVREIIGLMDITRAPGTREFMRGVINLRGKVIPVVDLRLKFGMEKVEPTDQTVIIVVQYTFNQQDITMGILVDEVVEVLDIQGGMIEPPPDFGAGAVNTDFILGVGKADRRVIFLLDIGRVLSPEEAREVLRNAQGAGQQQAAA